MNASSSSPHSKVGNTRARNAHDHTAPTDDPQPATHRNEQVRERTNEKEKKGEDVPVLRVDAHGAPTRHLLNPAVLDGRDKNVDSAHVVQLVHNFMLFLGRNHRRH